MNPVDHDSNARLTASYLREVSKRSKKTARDVYEYTMNKERKKLIAIAHPQSKCERYTFHIEGDVNDKALYLQYLDKDEFEVVGVENGHACGGMFVTIKNPCYQQNPQNPM